MILANPKTLQWKRVDPDIFIPYWDEVTAEWLEETERGIRESRRWNIPGDKNNELLGRSILWFYEVRDAFHAETQAAETHADEGEIDSQTYFPLAGPEPEEQPAARRR